MNTEQELNRQLHDQASRIDGAPITLDDVIGTAGRIKRRRRITTGVAALAAAAVIVPSAMFGGNLLDAGPDPVGPDPAEPEPRQVHDVVLDPSLPEGDPPALAYTDADQLVTPDGETVQLDHVYDGTVRVGDDYLAVRDNSSGEPKIDVLDSGWNVTDTFEAYAGAVGSADATVAAWLRPDGTVVLHQDGESVDVGKLDGFNPQIVAVQGSDACLEAGECRVFLNQRDADPVVMDTDGNTTEVPGALTSLGAVSTDGLLAGRTTGQDAGPDDGPCSAVVDESTQKSLFETCDLDFANAAGFSPDNELLVGTEVRSDGASPRAMTVVDARTGDVVTRIDLSDKPRTAGITTSTWEDDEHLLVHTSRSTATSPGLSNLYRVGLDGTVERLLERDHDNGTMTQPWLLIR